MFVEVVFPLALHELYSYVVPEEMKEEIQVGSRVEVELRNKRYAGIVVSFSAKGTVAYKPKPVLSILDSSPVITESMLSFWKWLASYYCCTLGEVMAVALPAGMKLSSETSFVLHPDYQGDFMELGDNEYMIAEALSIRHSLCIDDVQTIIHQKSIFAAIKNLLQSGVIHVRETLVEKFKPRKISVAKLREPWTSDKEKAAVVFSLLERSPKQTNALLAYFQLSANKSTEVPLSEIYALAGVDRSAVSGLEKKEILDVFEKEVSRLGKSEVNETAKLPGLSFLQSGVFEEVKDYFTKKMPVLLHGITGSGKTLIYSHLIKRCIQNNKQVLYLLPEIALTTQAVNKVQQFFSEKIFVYHSRMNNNERVELWNAARSQAHIVLGARSSLFLPFQDLGLIIVDEEHDPSYKQQDPNPRYNARDAAIYLARITGADIILGSATPAIESNFNVINGKYGLVELRERFGEATLPKIEVIDLKKEDKDQRFDGMLSHTLKEAVEQALERKEQVILFQNRRGYAPSVHCKTCGWKAMCQNCDISLTMHKVFHKLSCHYCGYKMTIPKLCPACGSPTLDEVGFGTEKIEDEISKAFPQARIARLDLDSASSKMALESILYDFEHHQTDILVGTQMLTKGLDFGNVSVVGILRADALLRYPDIRAGERAFQLMTQVGGRSGRKDKPGRVIIQTYQPNHPVIAETLHHDYHAFCHREMEERKKFLYPPFCRLIFLEITHQNASHADAATNQLAIFLREKLGKRVLGPAPGSIPRLRGKYVFQIVIKMENVPSIMHDIKNYILNCRNRLLGVKTYRDVRVTIDVDPY